MDYRNRTATITLAVQLRGGGGQLLERRIVLDSKTPSLRIGRASSKSAAVVPDVDNGYFDNPIMSRSHAEIHADPKYERVYVKDTQSSHGTWVNGIKIPTGLRHPLKDGSDLVFGTPLKHEDTTVQPCQLKVGIKWRQPKDIDGSGTIGFRVPEPADDSEPEDTIDRARRWLQEYGVQRSCPKEAPIDLTQDDAPATAPVVGQAPVPLASPVPDPVAAPIVAHTAAPVAHPVADEVEELDEVGDDDCRILSDGPAFSPLEGSTQNSVACLLEKHFDSEDEEQDGDYVERRDHQEYPKNQDEVDDFENDDDMGDYENDEYMDGEGEDSASDEELDANYESDGDLSEECGSPLTSPVSTVDSTILVVPGVPSGDKESSEEEDVDGDEYMDEDVDEEYEEEEEEQDEEGEDEDEGHEEQSQLHDEVPKAAQPQPEIHRLSIAHLVGDTVPVPELGCQLDDPLEPVPHEESLTFFQTVPAFPPSAVPCENTPASAPRPTTAMSQASMEPQPAGEGDATGMAVDEPVSDVRSDGVDPSIPILDAAILSPEKQSTPNLASNTTVAQKEAVSPIEPATTEAERRLAACVRQLQQQQQQEQEQQRSVSRKRKAEDMSIDDAEVQAKESEERGVQTMADHTGQIRVLKTNPVVIVEARPRKRSRYIADMVGYAALGGLAGGLALFGTLVASAPSFT